MQKVFNYDKKVPIINIAILFYNIVAAFALFAMIFIQSNFMFNDLLKDTEVVPVVNKWSLSEVNI